ncbi:hypothetical protein GDO81_008702 [Engystomops pustulosus]|uniref:Uncharacterized protein n=1 Tax=Engystomops pustulosus TaxID=76066 RepID=A0AAV7CHM0_ENGPU|nr:hypothetical protein GDO81_008702 [Engystomops pustulosus]
MLRAICPPVSLPRSPPMSPKSALLQLLHLSLLPPSLPPPSKICHLNRHTLRNCFLDPSHSHKPLVRLLMSNFPMPRFSTSRSLWVMMTFLT